MSKKEKQKAPARDVPRMTIKTTKGGSKTQEPPKSENDTKSESIDNA